MRDRRYRAAPDEDEDERPPSYTRSSRVSYHGNRLFSGKICVIFLTLAIALGAIILFIFTAFFHASDSETAFYRRAMKYITGDRFYRSNINEENNFPHKEILLPKDITPQRYQVYLHPNLTTFDFHGGVKIDIICEKPTRNILLHVKKLNITSYGVQDSHGNHLPVLRVAQSKKLEQYLVEMKDELKKDEKYTIKFDFNGQLSNTMTGFYKSSYKTKSGKTKHMATTQFEATDARAAFPCFDEPEFKAQFIVTLVHSKGYKALSNMPELKSVTRDDGFVESHFKESVKMSTYLLAFIVCDFAYKESHTKRGNRIRVWSRKDAINSTDLALSVAENVLNYYEKFFNIPYPLPKIDLIAVPDFAAGAMENWGLLTFRETYLLSDPASSSAADKQDVAIVVAHELAHQWFGNLVTMKWWNDLWLNEGFANYVEYIGTDHFRKDWRVLEQFVAHTLQTALSTDSMENTHPISVPVHNPSQITEIFDGISYDKHYLNNHKYGNAEADDLWAALSQVCDDLDVKAIMDTWIKQKGYPVVYIADSNVQVRDGSRKLAASQKRFLRDVKRGTRKYDDETKGYSWHIPLTFVTSRKPHHKETVWMKNTQVQIPIGNENYRWIKANVGQTGFYRVFASVDRSGLIDDAFNLARAGQLDMSTALGLTAYLDREREYVPWSSALSHLGFIGSMLSMRPSYGFYRKYIVKKVKPLEKYVGWESEGDILKMYLRNNVLSTLASHGDAHAFGGVEEWEFLWKKYQDTIDPTEKSRMIYALSGSKEPWLLNRLLEYSLDETKIRTQDMLHAISGVGSHVYGRLLTWDFIKKNFDKIVKKVGKDAMEISYLIGIATRGFNTEYQLKEAKEFVAQHKDVLGSLRATKKALEYINGCINWMADHGKNVEDWLQRQVESLSSRLEDL
ncbi:Endoplasmic reticulum aminopeptidase 1 [Acropora cervicornis]|uniref:Aminopeptidase n=1 Tax=Acropora cervicornis TaxID=6130 RepID=A0AAD9V5Q6_ACRCE|nr:Endoplasmic reticulum aminopeptidase 1 [Acropora cervicornis]